MQRKQPNFIYILADDMGYGDLSCLNPDSKINTVHMDSMARDGISFTDAHSSSAVCTPSRYSILTGRYNWRSTLKEFVLMGYSGALIEPGRETVASMLRSAGYATACVGKWHLGMNFTKSGSGEEDIDFAGPITGGPVDCGFDTYYGISGSLDMPPYVYIENNHFTHLPDHETEGKMPGFWRKGPTAPDFRHEDVLPHLTEKALDVIETHKDEPFFLYFPLPAPHTPILPAEKFCGATQTNAYGDFVLMCDDVVGQVLKKLEACGIADDTVVVFTSDNGCSPWANYPELLAAGHNPSYHFRGHKADIYEGGHRVPLLVRWPAGIAPGAACSETVCLSDFMATVADLLQLPLADNMAEDSVSNLPLWLRKEYSSPLREATVHHSIDGCFSIRQGAWKLELCPGSGGWSDPKPGEEPEGTLPYQLYYIDDDVSERRNVAAEHPQIVESMRLLLKRYVEEGRSTPGKPQQNTGAPFWPQLCWMEKNLLSEALR